MGNYIQDKKKGLKIKINMKLEKIDKKVVIATFKTFAKSYELDYIPQDYIDYVVKYFEGFRETTKFDRFELESEFNDYILDEFECWMDEKEKWFDKHDREVLETFNKHFFASVLPIWKDDCKHYCNLGWLVDRYDLDMDDLYFDADGNCIRDKEGNIWYD